MNSWINWNVLRTLYTKDISLEFQVQKPSILNCIPFSFPNSLNTETFRSADSEVFDLQDFVSIMQEGLQFSIPRIFVVVLSRGSRNPISRTADRMFISAISGIEPPRITERTSRQSKQLPARFGDQVGSPIEVSKVERGSLRVTEDAPRSRNRSQSQRHVRVQSLVH